MVELISSHSGKHTQVKRSSSRQKMLLPVNPREIVRQMDELATRFVETHDIAIAEELYKLARELEKMEKE